MGWGALAGEAFAFGSSLLDDSGDIADAAFERNNMIQDKLLQLGSDGADQLDAAYNSYLGTVGSAGTLDPATINARGAQYTSYLMDEAEKALVREGSLADASLYDRGLKDSTLNNDLTLEKMEWRRQAARKSSIDGFNMAVGEVDKLSNLRSQDITETGKLNIDANDMRTGALKSASTSASDSYKTSEASAREAAKGFGSSLRGTFDEASAWWNSKDKYQF